MREHSDCGNPQFARTDGGLRRLIDVEAIDTGHGLHRDAWLLAVMDNHAPDKVVRARLGFADEPAGPVVLAQAAQPRRRVSACDQGLGHGSFLL